VLSSGTLLMTWVYMHFLGMSVAFRFFVVAVVAVIVVFQSAAAGGHQFTPDEQVLAYSMTQAWGNFAWTGNPNLPVSLETSWPEYNPSDDTILAFQTPDSTTSDFRARQCDMWDTIGYVVKNIKSQDDAPVNSD